MILAGQPTRRRPRVHRDDVPDPGRRGSLAVHRRLGHRPPTSAPTCAATSPTSTPEAREILRALGAGLTDEAAARRLGVSLRTYRRRVAELMATLDADSRFQAGVRAGELGLPR